MHFSTNDEECFVHVTLVTACTEIVVIYSHSQWFKSSGEKSTRILPITS